MHDTASGGESQRLTLTIPGGSVAAAVSFNRGSGGREVVRLEGLADGTYVLRAELFAAKDLQGAMRGVIETPIIVDTLANFETVVGQTPTGIRLNPSSITLQGLQGVRFYAHPVVAGGTATFATADYTWSMSPIIGTIATDGYFSPAGPGNTTVQALHVPTSLTGTASVQVQGDGRTP
jgi:hypothetical protein